MQRKHHAWTPDATGAAMTPRPEQSPALQPAPQPVLKIFSGGSPDEPPPGSSPKQTLSLFFEDYVLPTSLQYADPRTVRQYRETLRFWERFALSPEASEIGPDQTRLFVTGLKTLPGRSRKKGSIAANTIRKHCVHAQFVLDRLGPKTRHNPEGAGLLAEPPEIAKPPLVIDRRIKRFSLEEIGKQADNAAAALAPANLLGTPPGVFWESLYIVAYNTALRIETLQLLEFDWLEEDNDGWWLRCPPAALKKPVGRDFFVNAFALEAIGRMRRHGRALIFPWDHCDTYLHKTRLKILVAAGIPTGRRFGFHGLRRACISELSRINPAAAKMAAGHSGDDVTIDYYTDLSIMTNAMKRLPQPPRQRCGHQLDLF